MTDFVNQILSDAKQAGFSFLVTYDDEVDYKGDDVKQAIEAIEACDEMAVTFLDTEQKTVGWMLVINGLADDERIANFSGAWIDQWHKRYVQ